MRKGLFICFILIISSNAFAELQVYYQDSGNLSISVDGVGTHGSSGEIIVRKPTGATVKKIFAMAVSNNHRVISDSDISINGKPISWEREVFNGIPGFDNFFHNVLSDITSLFKEDIDTHNAGDIIFTTTEIDINSIDGVVLVVIFNDPSITSSRSVSLFFGDQSTGGDEFLVSFKNELTEIPEVLNLGLGMSYGFQGLSGTNMVNLIDINGQRLTSSAGGEDDGTRGNGALITVGGIGDSNSNPPPNAPSSSFDTDDELYDLRDFLSIGDNGFTISSNNPSDDDNIFFAYLYSSIETAALPPVSKPRDKSLKFDPINKDLPTVVLVHGLSEKNQNIGELWTGFKSTQAGGLIHNDIGDKVNVIQYIWEDSFQVTGLPNQTEYESARDATMDAGVNLANQLIKILGTDYNNKIHFIGHSLGTVVSTYAISALLEENRNIKDLQFTALDRPDHVGKIGFLVDSISEKEEKELGYHSEFFVVNLPFLTRPNLNLIIDNYYTKSIGVGVGDIADRITLLQKIYNIELIDPGLVALVLTPDELPSNDHSGVHQWYRWTILNSKGVNNDNEYCKGSDFSMPARRPAQMDDSLSPCNRGWYWSINKNNSLSSLNRLEPNKKIFDNVKDATIKDFKEFGCTTSPSVITVTNSLILNCKEQSSPFSVSTITIPEGTNFISFDYKFDNRGDGDYAAILIDGEEIWKMSGASIITEGAFANTGKLPLSVESGDRNLTIALYGVEEKNAEFEIQNIKLHSIQSIPVVDSDTDGIPDGYEDANGLNKNDPADALLDGDGDGLNNLEEFQNGTRANNPDTDGDGANDGDEVAASTDPLDPDSFPPPTAIPTLSEWAMIFLVFCLSLIGLGITRRRYNA